ncbi:MAG: glycoside hydrolase family 16 protein, partial [Rhizomicrobium sp.]
MAGTPSFDEGFTSLSLWNGTSGTWDSNYWYNPLNGNGGSLPTNGEQEWYVNANDPATSSIVPWSVSDGILTITGDKAPASIQPLIDNYQYTSGELNTYHSFSQTYGFFEMRAELP